MWVASPEPTPFDILARQASSTTHSSTPAPSATSTQSTSTTSDPSSTTTSSQSGLFDFPQASTASPSPTSGAAGHRSVPQLVLEWAIAFIAVSVLLSVVFFRYAQLRRRGRPFSHMFSRAPARPASPSSRPFRHTYRHTTSGAPDVILPSQPLHAAIHSDALFTIPTLPVQGRGRRAVRGADTDAQGRREGPVDPEEHEEGIEKEILPAYDAGQKGPPRYADVMYGFNPFRRAAGQPGGEHVELSQLGIPDRHPADRPLGGDPFEDGSHGGLTQTTTRESRDPREPEHPPATHGSRPASRNENEASTEPPSLTMPEPHTHPAPSYSPSPSTEHNR